jgi:hypothetical protein
LTFSGFSSYSVLIFSPSGGISVKTKIMIKRLQFLLWEQAEKTAN